MDKATMGARFKQARLSKGLTQEALGEMCDCGTTYISDIERGAKFPSMSLFIRMVNALDVSSDFILRGELNSGKTYVYDELTRKLENLTPQQKLPADQRKSEQLDAHLGKLKEELERNQRYKRLTFEKFNDGIIDETMFWEYTDIYTKKCEELETAIAKRKEEVDALLSGNKETKKWISIFKNHRGVKKLDRMLLIKLIDHVDIFDDNRISIVFRYQDQFNTALSIIENYRKESASFG